MPRYHLFDVYGIELEYMIVDRDTLAIKSIADELLKHELGSYGSDFENGIVTWSNELVLHVIELKSSKPENDFTALEKGFADNVSRINKNLAQWNAMLLPGAAHPFINPLTEVKLWPHDNNEVYELYNQIFDCKGHGWSNLQSTHLNLPFDGEEEFARLHAAIRLVLPIVPALCASSPIIGEKRTRWLDTRLHYYKTNQERIPSITGNVIPEAVFSKSEYQEIIYNRIRTDIESYNRGDVLDPIWVNSRGAIPRFDRGSIEIRLMDVQECPAADLAIQTLVIETIKAFVSELFIDYQEQTKWNANSLALILEQGIELAEGAVITNEDFLRVFGMNAKSCSMQELWRHIANVLKDKGDMVNRKRDLETLLDQGTLSTRIIKALNGDYSNSSIVSVYTKLSHCLAVNNMFRE